MSYNNGNKFQNKAKKYITFLGIAVFWLATVAAIVAFGWFVFVYFADVSGLSTLEILVIALIGAVVVRRIWQWLENYYDSYEVLEVDLDGKITRSSDGFSVKSGSTVSADELENEIETADEDEDVNALLVSIDSRGGELIPSIDIAQAISSFDGRTVAYIDGTCASGAYIVASCCDTVVARENALVGNIGVRSSKRNVSELADTLGITYEPIVAGKFKDTGEPTKEMTSEEREYLQSIVDRAYENMIEFIAEKRGLDPAGIRDTEARLFYADDAQACSLVDDVGTRGSAIDLLRDSLGQENLAIGGREEGSGSLFGASISAESVARGFGRGVAEAFVQRTARTEELRRE